MSAIVTGWLGSTTSGLIAEWFGHVLASRSDLENEERARRQSAVDSLIARLRELQDITRRYGVENVGRDEIQKACKDWAVAREAGEKRILLRRPFVLRSVQQAVGTVFGGVAYIHTQPDLKLLELPAPDVMWLDFVDEYLGYVASRLERSGNSVRNKPIPVMSFDDWLVETELREPFGTVSTPDSARAVSRTGARRALMQRRERVALTELEAARRTNRG